MFFSSILEKIITFVENFEYGRKNRIRKKVQLLVW